MKPKFIVFAICAALAAFYCTHKAWETAHTSLGSIGGRVFTPFDYEDGVPLFGYFGLSQGGPSLADTAKRYQALTFVWSLNALGAVAIALATLISGRKPARKTATLWATTAVCIWVALFSTGYYFALQTPHGDIPADQLPQPFHLDTDRFLRDLRQLIGWQATILFELALGLIFIRRTRRIGLAVVVLGLGGLLSTAAMLFNVVPYSPMAQFAFSAIQYIPELFFMKVLAETASSQPDVVGWKIVRWPALTFLVAYALLVLPNQTISGVAGDSQGWSLLAVWNYLRVLAWSMPYFLGWLCFYRVAFRRPHPVKHATGIYLLFSGGVLLIGLTPTVYDNNFWHLAVSIDQIQAIVSMIQGIPFIAFVAYIIHFGVSADGEENKTSMRSEPTLGGEAAANQA